MNRVVWLVMLSLIVFFADRAYDKMAADAGSLDVRIEKSEPGTVVLKWRGPIEHPMASEIAEAFNANRDHADRFLLVLSSPGGLLSHGNDVIRLLETIKKTHRLDTAVDDDDNCASMCVPIYLRGQTRFAGPESRWMFHQVSVREAISDKEKGISDLQRSMITDEFFNRYFRPVGVPSSWVDQMRKRVGGGDVWLDGRDLASDGSGIITQLN